MPIRVAIVENTSQTTGSVRSIVSAMQELRSEVEPIFIGPHNDYIRSHGFRQVDVPFLQLGRNPRMALYPARLLRDAMRLARVVRSEDLQLVHVNDFYNLVGLVARPMIWRVPTIYHVRLLSTSYLGPIYRPLRHAALLGATRVLAVSRAVAQDLNAPHRVTVVHDGIHVPPETSRPPASDGIVRVLYLAHFVDGKGHKEALDAFAVALNSAPHLQLRFVGGTLDNPRNAALERHLRHAVQARGLSHAVHFVGETSDVEREFERADIILNLSHSESFSMVCLEGMATGRPVVAAKSGGPDELLEGEDCGVLVSVGGVAEAARALVWLANDVDARARIGQRARARAKAHFDISITAGKLLDAYRAALAPASARTPV